MMYHNSGDRSKIDIPQKRFSFCAIIVEKKLGKQYKYLGIAQVVNVVQANIISIANQ